ncbi:hypothetical protein [Desulfococcus multivorans]|uniref:Uncharacterized protein n=1 Tax=Desulfococcus multivorans DSM 2059 TaxID=1121405 RepID=S7T5Y4_DESML|nr:hypothetical protein [Desulfococcus multivorans]AOY59431.1 uncharacterized protein Dmul_26590 [Desulfococcus multivorans]AQV01636.1 hypothetical protein B2D07_13275 [Desulfococcus multivorans]EPR32462.1 hypothetical protein dsmv_3654 [Desulfococcus multivorans DSM 2059]SKA00657.1 hypothetical protein SAMN02745446_02383 [Desulfococcus multivorans DSM 2059]
MYEQLKDSNTQCDLCGMKDPEGIIYRSDNFIYLCSKCMEKIKTAPDSLSETLERTLMGNVL